MRGAGHGPRILAFKGNVFLKFAGEAPALGGLLLEKALVFQVLDVLSSLPVPLLSVFTGFDQLCNSVSDFSHVFLLNLMMLPDGLGELQPRTTARQNSRIGMKALKPCDIQTAVVTCTRWKRF